MKGPLASPPGSRVVVISGTIDADMVGQVAVRLAELNAMSPEPVHAQIFSSGGSLLAGWALYDLFSTNATPVITQGHGYVGSAATIAFQGGVARLLGPNATVMIHEVKLGVPEDRMLTLKEMHGMVAEMTGLQRGIEKMLKRRTGQPIARIRRWCAEEAEFEAADAIRYGFADEMLAAWRQAPGRLTKGRK